MGAPGQNSTDAKAGEEAHSASTWQSVKAHVKEFVEASPEEHKVRILALLKLCRVSFLARADCPVRLALLRND